MQVTPMVGDDQRVVGTSLVAAASRYVRMIVAIVLVAQLLGLTWGITRPAEHVATARLVLLDPNGAEVFQANEVPGDDERYVRTQARFVRSDAVLERAAESVGVSLDTLGGALSVTTGVDDDFVIVSITASTPDRASTWLDSVTDSYRAIRSEVVQEELQRALAEIDTLLVGASEPVEQVLEERAAILAVNAAVYGDGVDFVQDIELTSSSTLRRIAFNVVLGGMAGLAIALLLAWQRAERDPLVRTATDIRRLFGTPLIGRVPILDLEDRLAGSGSRFESIALGLFSEQPDMPRRQTLIFTADKSGVGVSTVVDNLATAGAENGLNIMIIDAGGRIDAPVPAGEGTAAYVEETLISTKRGGLKRLRPDVANRGTIDELYRSGRLERFTSRFNNEHDFVLIDCPALDVDATALRLAPLADSAVVVVRHLTRLADVEETVDLLTRVDLPIRGYIQSFEPKGGR